MTAHRKFFATIRTGARDAGRSASVFLQDVGHGMLEVSHNMLALVGLLLVGTAIFVFTRPDLFELIDGIIANKMRYSILTNGTLITEETLKDIIPVINKPITIDAIMQSVSSYFHISVADLQAKRRSQDVAMPRQIAMYLCRKLTNTSLMEIGEKFGGKDHSTVLHSIKKVEEKMSKDLSFKEMIEKLQGRIKS